VIIALPNRSKCWLVTGIDPTGLECIPQGKELKCDPPGDEIGEYTIPRPEGHPGVISSDDNYDSYTTGADTTDTSSGLLEAATSELIRNPTPGVDRPATPKGTRNDAGVSPPLPGGDQVMSYVATDSNGNTVVVNLSIPDEHVFHPAVLSQVVTQDEYGTHVTVVGESTSWIHSGGNGNPINIAARLKFGKMSMNRLSKHTNAPVRMRTIQ